MSGEKTTKVWYRSGVVWFSVLAWVGYAWLTMMSPPGSNRFELSESTLAVLRLTIAVPYLLIWLTTIYGALRLSSYAEQISESKEGQAFLVVARGLFVLVAGMIAATVLSTLRSYWPEVVELQAPLTVLANYFHVFFPLVGFGLIFWGARQLRATVLPAQGSTSWLLPVLVIVGVVAGVYVLAIFTNPTRQMSDIPEVMPTYYLADWLIVLTLAVPAMASWLLGLLAVANLAGWRRMVRGSVYLKGARWVVWGLNLVVISAMLLQLLVSAGGERLFALGLGPLLLVIYVWLLAMVLGYASVAVGARKLTAIESIR